MKRAFDPAWRPGGVILAYHRVAELASDPQRLAVSPRNFRAHLDILAREGTPMTLGGMVDAAASDQLPPRPVAVTIDDGYADTWEAAAPALVERKVPASIFVTTGAVAAAREFWWDELERLLLLPRTLPHRIAVEIDGAALVYEVNGDRTWPDADRLRHAAWTVEHDSTPTLRHHAYRDLTARLRRASVDGRHRAIAQLESAIDAPARTSHRPMTPAELCELASVDAIELGSHTASHASLAHLDRDGQRQDVVAGQQQLRGWTDSTPTTFAYPFGAASDVSSEVVDAVRDAGVTLACTTTPGRVHAGTDPLRLPRMVVRDWDADTFRARLREWMS